MSFHITAIRGNWMRFLARKRNPNFINIEKKIFARDKNTCRYCGFKTEKYLEVVNNDQNYSNNVASNLWSACALCYQCFFLDRIGQLPNTGGKIIYLPEISQADLNNFCRVLFAVVLKDVPYRGKLHASYLSLQDRAQTVEEMFGPESSDPQIFGQILIDSGYVINDKSILYHLRVLPNNKSMKEMINYWKTTLYDALPL